MRPLVRSATLDGYVALARVARPRPGQPDARRRAGRRGPGRSRQVGLGGRGLPAAGRLGRRVRSGGLRAPARRAAPAVHARSAERGAARGARPAQRPDAAATLRAQLQRGAADAPRRVRGHLHDAAVVRVRGARPGRTGTRPGRRGAARHHPRVCGAGLEAAVDLLPAPLPHRPQHAPRGVRPGPAVRARVHRAGVLHQRPRRCEPALGPADAALRPAVPQLVRVATGDELLGSGAGAGRVLPAGREVLHGPGRSRPRRRSQDAASSSGRGGRVVQLDPQRDACGLAERHLANDRYSITDVAYQLGFAAPSAFSRWFQQQFGVSPRTWRETANASRAHA